MKKELKSEDRYYSIKIKKDTFYDFEKLRAELSTERNKIMKKTAMIDFLMEEIKKVRTK